MPRRSPLRPGSRPPSGRRRWPARGLRRRARSGRAASGTAGQPGLRAGPDRDLQKGEPPASVAVSVFGRIPLITSDASRARPAPRRLRPGAGCTVLRRPLRASVAASSQARRGRKDCPGRWRARPSPRAGRRPRHPGRSPTRPDATRPDRSAGRSRGEGGVRAPAQARGRRGHDRRPDERVGEHKPVAVDG